MSGTFLNNFKVSYVYISSGAQAGTTGDASFGSGSTVPPTTTIGTGFPFNSTCLDMSGFSGVCFIAEAPDTTSLRLSVGWANTSGAGTTSYTHFPNGSIESTGQNAGYSTRAQAIAIEVVKPVKRWVQATCYIPTTSAILSNIVAIQYRANKGALAAFSTAYLVSNSVIIDGTTA